GITGAKKTALIDPNNPSGLTPEYFDELERKGTHKRCTYPGCNTVVPVKHWDEHIQERHSQGKGRPGMSGEEDAKAWWKSTPNDKRRELSEKLGINRYWSHFVWDSLPSEIKY